MNGAETGVDAIGKLYKEIRRFSKWADKNHPDWSEENDNGEWEEGAGSGFDEMLDAAIHVIAEHDCSDADDRLIDALLFVVARDNECEMIAQELTEHEEWYELLAGRSVGSKYVNAQWQFAKYLGECKDRVRELIFAFIESDHEYTSRMALGTMAELDPACAEKYAVSFWNRGKYPAGSYEDEYQKIMALRVLEKIGSPKLEEYLEKALSSGYKWLRENAQEITQASKQEQ